MRHFGCLTHPTWRNPSHSTLADPCASPLGLPLPLSSVPALCSLELRRTLRTVRAALETFDVVGGVRIVFLAPALDDQLIASGTAGHGRGSGESSIALPSMSVKWSVSMGLMA